MLSLSNGKLLQNLLILSDFVGRIDVGGDEEITVASLRNDDINAQDTLCVLSGDNNGIDIVITDFDDGVISLSGNDKTLSNRDMIGIVSIPFDSYITQAERYLKNDFRNKGAILDNFLNTEQLEQLHIYKTLSLICGDRRNSTDQNDSYNANFQRFETMYQTEFSNLLADYDENEDGTISTDEELIFKGQVGFTR